MKIEDLQLISTNNSMPSASMTDEQWQEYFSFLKSVTEPAKEKRMSTRSAAITVNGYSDTTQFKYSGETNWFRYCQFINGVLTTIRKGEVDYCYYTYQIEELLKYENERLVVKWNQSGRYFEVSLEKVKNTKK